MGGVALVLHDIISHPSFDALIGWRPTRAGRTNEKEVMAESITT
jgi:hypothetical protein